MATKTESAPAGTADVVRGYFDALARQDLEAAGDHWASGGLDRLHGLADLRGPEDVRDYFAALFAAFPDFRFDVISMAAEGELAAVRWRTRATFTGPGRFQGFAPNGATLDLEGCDMLTVRDGLIQENHAYTNAADLARQVGALPPAGSVPERALTAMVNARTRIARLLRR
jgi:predicted ester cyclase